MRGKRTDKEEVRTWIELLVPVLQRGTALKNACEYLKIPYTTVRDWIDRDKLVRIQIDAATNYLDMVAETVIADKIITEKSDFNARWRLERSQKDKYSARTDITTKGEKIKNSKEEMKEACAELLEDLIKDNESNT